MDILDILKSDHERVADLFDQFESTDQKTERWRLFQMVKRELSHHAQLEETIFYPAFQRYEDLKGLIDESLREHAQVKELLASIDQLGRESGAVEDRVLQLRESVDHHVDEEENRLFPQVRRLMKRNEREILGRHLMAAKQERTAA
jgi:iron-sulfur cluster repair protein YtfE (RIC family)